MRGLAVLVVVMGLLVAETHQVGFKLRPGKDGEKRERRQERAIEVAAESSSGLTMMQEEAKVSAQYSEQTQGEVIPNDKYYPS